ncbi:hypothetical protein [Thermomonospora umbrina]|nr:hypothetical protein [Thermomonospora umbrina]
MDTFRIALAAAVAAGLGVVVSPSALAASPPAWRVSFRGASSTFIDDVAAVGPQRAWAAGRRVTKRFDPRNGGYFNAPVLRRWDGRTWTAVPTPAGPKGFPLRELSLVEASSPGNVWTAGTATSPTGDLSSADRSVLSRWDGGRWRLMGSGRTTILDLDLLGSRHAYIVGRNDRNGTRFFKHFQDGRWTSLPAPAGLREVSVRAPGDIWGIGSSGLLHWNGRTWRTVQPPKIKVPAAPTPGYGRVTVRLDEVLATPKDGVWVAAGFQQGDWSQPGTVLLHLKGGTWRQTRLPKDVVQTLTGDGGNGFWAATYRETITATPQGGDPYAYTILSIDTLRHTAGRLTRQNLTPTTTGFRWTALSGIPGTGSALAAGFNWVPSSSSVIFRYLR